MWSKRFWVAALERALKTFAQGAAAMLGANAVGLLDVDWVTAGSVAGLTALLSLLTSIGSSPFGPGDSPSVVDRP